MGRAEDASISINHNSVSRLHCEIHALGDGRFEIVDKGSSNGVRVNSAELRRGIIEPGDVIELGDVKFKFVGAGQIFRPTESQQLAVLNERAAGEIVRASAERRRCPVVLFVVVVVARREAPLGCTIARSSERERGEPVDHQTPVAAQSPEQLERQGLGPCARCAAGDCEAAHEKLSTLPKARPSARPRSTRSREQVGRTRCSRVGRSRPRRDGARSIS